MVGPWKRLPRAAVPAPSPPELTKKRLDDAQSWFSIGQSCKELMILLGPFHLEMFSDSRVSQPGRGSRDAAGVSWGSWPPLQAGGPEPVACLHPPARCIGPWLSQKAWEWRGGAALPLARPSVGDLRGWRPGPAFDGSGCIWLPALFLALGRSCGLQLALLSPPASALVPSLGAPARSWQLTRPPGSKGGWSRPGEGVRWGHHVAEQLPVLS